MYVYIYTYIYIYFFFFHQSVEWSTIHLVMRETQVLFLGWVRKIHWSGSLLQYSCLENSMDRGAWRATVHEVSEFIMTEQLSVHTCMHTHMHTHIWLGFPGGSDGKESACNAGDLGSIPVFGRSPGGGHGNSLQYSYLGNSHGQRSLAGYSP